MESYIFEKLQCVAEVLECHEWSDKDTTAIKNIFRVWQMFLESMYSSCVQRPVIISKIEVKVGNNAEEFENWKFEDFSDICQLSIDEETKEASLRPFEILQEFLESLTVDEDGSLSADRAFQKPVKSPSKATANKREKKKRSSSKRKSSKVTKSKKVDSGGTPDLHVKETTVNSTSTASVKKRKGDPETEKKNIKSKSKDTKNQNVDTGTTPDQPATKKLGGTEKEVEQDLSVGDSGVTRPYGTRRNRKRKKLFNADDFEVSWPKSAKTSVKLEEDATGPVTEVNDGSNCYFSCSKCQIQFDTKSVLGEHLQTSHAEDDPTESVEETPEKSCRWCDETSIKNNSTYREHIKKYHVTVKDSLISISCPKCTVVAHCKGSEKTEVLMAVLLDHVSECHGVSGIDKIKEGEDSQNNEDLESEAEELEDLSDANYNKDDDDDDGDDDDDDDSDEEDAKQTEQSKQPKQSKRSKRSKKSEKATAVKECPYCSKNIVLRCFAGHCKSCKEKIGMKGQLRELPEELPLSACPLCKDEKDCPKFNRLSELIEHIKTKHKDPELSCPSCKLKWTRNAPKGRTEAQCQQAFALKVFLHFVLNHDHLVQGSAEKTVAASNGTENEGEEQNSDPPPGRDVDNPVVTEGNTGAPENSKESQGAEQIVSSSGNDAQVVEEINVVVPSETNEREIVLQENNGQISIIASDTMDTVTAVNSLLSGQQDIMNQAGCTVHYHEGEIDLSAIQNMHQGVQVVEYVNLAGDHGYTQVIYQNAEEVRSQSTVVVDTGSDANIDYSKMSDPFPEEFIYVCFLCPERPRYMHKSSFFKHVHDMHFEKNINEANEEIISIQCQDCEEGVFSGVLGSQDGREERLFEYLVQHRMLNHFRSKPEFTEVRRCHNCQFETLCRVDYWHHFRKKTECYGFQKMQTEERDEREYQCIVCRMEDSTRLWDKFIGEQAYIDHMKEKHLELKGEKALGKCHICERVYSGHQHRKASMVMRVISFLSNHLVQAHDAEVAVQDKVVDCPLCKSQMNNAKLLKAHLTRAHRLFREKVLKKSDEHLCSSCNGAVKRDIFASHEDKCCRIQKKLTGKDKVICEICGKSITFDHYQTTHRFTCSSKTTEAEKEYKCTVCPKGFLAKAQLQSHLRKAHGDSHSRKCSKCGLMVTGKKAYQDHMMQTHNINTARGKIVECPVCDFKGFTRVTRKHCLDVHGVNFNPAQGSLKQPTWYVCELCDYRSNTEHSFKSHLAHKHRINRFGCHLCRYVSYSQVSLDKHLEKIHPRGETNVNFCEICQKQFGSPSSYDNHLFVKHGVNNSKRSVVQCEICGFQTLGMSLLKNHMKNHEMLSLECDMCGKQFTSAVTLRSHRARHMKKVHCTHCNLACVDRTHLDRHIARVHTEIIFKCDFCHYKTFTDRLYRIHLQIKHECSLDVAKQLIETSKARSSGRRNSRASANRRSAVVVSSDEGEDDDDELMGQESPQDTFDSVT